MSKHNFTVRSGFSVIVNAPCAEDFRAVVYTANSVINADGPVTFSIPADQSTVVVTPPDHTLGGETTFPGGAPIVALSDRQLLGHLHKLVPFDADASAALAALAGSIHTPDASVC